MTNNSNFILKNCRPVRILFGYEKKDCRGERIADSLLIRRSKISSGVIFGRPNDYSTDHFVAMPQGTDGNIVIIGGNGSGKSSGIALPTVAHYKGPFCVTDIKGEISKHYMMLYYSNQVTRPYLIFNPMDPCNPGYDPFWWLRKDNKNNLITNLHDIVISLLPDIPNDHQPFWRKMEQMVLKAALYYFYKLGLDFISAIIETLSQPISVLYKEMAKSPDCQLQIMLGEISAMKPEQLASIDAGLRANIELFASDPYICNAFQGNRKKLFTWDDLKTTNIFLCIPENKIEAWSGAINLMYSQLIRYLERQPDKYCQGFVREDRQVLLLMDEFARFGKLERITSALSTLRSKGVTICLIIQSLAQLDKIYGTHDREIMLDNCQFQVILRANDLDTQKYLSERIGTYVALQRGLGVHYDEKNCLTGYNEQLNESRQLIIQPHELAILKDVILLSPHGFHQIHKITPEESTPWPFIFTYNGGQVYKTAIRLHEARKSKEGEMIMSIEEVKKRADAQLRDARQKEQSLQRKELDEQKRNTKRLNYQIGDLVTQYFPSLKNANLNGNEESQDSLRKFEAILYTLSIEDELLQELEDRAEQLIASDPNDEWRLSKVHE